MRILSPNIRGITIHAAVLACMVMLFVQAAPAQTGTTEPRAPRTLGMGAIRMVENRGQVADTRGGSRPDIRFTSALAGMRLFFRRDGISYVFARWTPAKDSESAGPVDAHRRILGPAHPGTLESVRMDMVLIGASEGCVIAGDDRTDDRSNFYTADHPDGIIGVPAFRRVVYRDIYPHIDLIVYGDGARLKYDVVVHPGGRVSDIRWRYDGAVGSAIGPNGALEARSELGTLMEAAPVAYQGGRRVRCDYAADGGSFGYRIGAYDRGRDLVIDPPLQWATYAGGSDLDSCGGIASDWNGNVLIAGTSRSINFPVTPGVPHTSIADTLDVVVFKLSPGGNLMWSTYFGGSGPAKGIACDRAGNIGVTGHGAGRTMVAELNNAGVQLWKNSMDSNTIPHGITFDRRGNIVVVGATFDSRLPLISAIQTTLQGFVDGFIAKYNLSGTLIYSTYFGGSNFDELLGVAANDNGDIVVCGYSWSDDIPIFGTPFKRRDPSRGATADAILCYIDATNTPRWSTYFGATTRGLSTGVGVAFDSSGSVIMVGQTASHDIPLSGSAAQRTHAPGDPDDDGFVVKFDALGGFVWSTYCGGPGNETMTSVAVSPGGSIFVAGTSKSTSFPVTPGAYQPTLRGFCNATVVGLDSGGTTFTWATYYGGTQQEMYAWLAYDTRSVYLAGTTFSNDLSGTANGFQRASAGAGDIFVAKFNIECPAIKPVVSALGSLTLCEGDSLVLTTPAGYRGYTWSPGNQSGRSLVIRRSGSYAVTAMNADGCTGTSSVVKVTVNPRPVAAITPAGPISICRGDSVLLDVARPGLVGYQWSTGDTLARIWARDSGTYIVRVVDTNGCRSDSIRAIVRLLPAPAVPVLAGADTVWLCPDSTLRLDAGAGYTSYTWAPTGARGRSIQVATPGTYYVDVANAAGCHVRSDSVVVIAYPRVPVDLVVQGSTSLCFGDSVILRLPPGDFSQPKWVNGSTADSVVVTATGVYFVTVTDSNGCRERSNAVSVVVHPKILSAINGPSAVCTSARPLYAVAGAGALRYAWSVAGDGAIAGAADADSVRVQWNASGDGTVTVTATDTVTGCSATRTITVTIGTSLKPAIAARAFTICAGDSVELDAGPGYTGYRWSNGSTARSIWVRDSAAYAVAVEDASGCKGTSDTVRVVVETLAPPTIGGSATVCIASTVSYAVTAPPGATCAWTVTGGTITAGDGTPAVTVQWGNGAAGAIDVTVTSAAGCSATAHMDITIGNQLKPSVTPAGSLTLCAGDSLTLDAGAGYASYRWSSGETTRTIIVRQAGAYTVTVADASGCGGTSDPVTVTLRTPRLAAIAPSGPITLAPGDSVVLDAGPGWLSYRWTLGPASGPAIGASRTIVARASGDYTATVVDSGGCRVSASVSVSGGELDARAELALDTVQAAPGAPVKVPLRLISSTNLDAAGATGFTARVRYRVTALVPDGATHHAALDREDRIVTYSGVRPAGMTSGLLGTVEFIAALGDTLATPLAIDGVAWTGSAGEPRGVTTTAHPGLFSLIGYCPLAGPRLATTGEAAHLKAVVPNPAGGVVRIEYDLLEDGPTRLAIVDMFGREVATLVAGARVGGTYSESFDAAALADGAYMIVLTTPSGRTSAVLDVIR